MRDTAVEVSYIDSRPSQICRSKDGESCIFCWPVIGRDCVGKLGWQYGTRLKSHGTVTNWRTGKGWSVNCMTVISARWQSNMAFQGRRKLYIPLPSYGKRLSGRKTLYNPSEDKKSGSLEIGRVGDQMSWRSDELENNAVEKTAPNRRGPRDPRLSCWRVDAGLRNMSQRGCAPRSPVEQPRRPEKKHGYGHKSVAVLFGLQLPLTYDPFNKVRGIYF